MSDSNSVASALAHSPRNAYRLQHTQGIGCCPNCLGTNMVPVTMSGQGLAFRCHDCNVKIEVTNPSALNPKWRVKR